MLSRFLIIRLVLLVAPIALEALKKEAAKTPNQIDDSLISIGEVIIGLLRSGELDEHFKKS